MHQSSITAWLKKPASVTKADKPASTTAPASPPSIPQQPITPPDTNPSTPELEQPQPSIHETQVKPAANFSLPPLPSNCELVPLAEDLMPAFKRLNALTLPVPYPAAFYTESMQEPHHGITLIAIWRTTPLRSETTSTIENPRRVVGAIRCRVLESDMLYISTIGLLAPYRSHGIASHLLYNVIAKAAKKHNVTRVTAHVWEANEEGLEWYAKRGFEVIGRKDNYYSKLKPSGALLVVKNIRVADLLASRDTARAEEG